MVSTRPLISKSFSPCISLLVTVLRVPITIRITVTFTFHSFFNPRAKSGYLSFFSLSFNFTLWSAGIAKPIIRWSPLVLLFPNFSFSLPIFWELFREYQLQLVSPLPSCSIVCFFNFQASLMYLSLFSAKSTIRQVFLFFFFFFFVDYHSVWSSGQD